MEDFNCWLINEIYKGNLEFSLSYDTKGRVSPSVYDLALSAYLYNLTYIVGLDNLRVASELSLKQVLDTFGTLLNTFVYRYGETFAEYQRSGLPYAIICAVYEGGVSPQIVTDRDFKLTKTGLRACNFRMLRSGRIEGYELHFDGSITKLFGELSRSRVVPLPQALLEVSYITYKFRGKFKVFNVYEVMSSCGGQVRMQARYNINK